ncbi:unnamed protein product [Rotaria sp. Silwood1]|nr:unnamed protein product [Rotaria sp. Silwood1]
MRLLTALALVLVSITFVQCQLVVPQFNDLDVLTIFKPQIQHFLAQLDTILSQIANFLSSFELQSLKDKLTEVLVTQLGSNLNLNAIKDKLRPVLQQFLGSKSQARFDFDTIVDQVSNAAVTSLPAILLGFLGKREAVDARSDLDDVLALYNKLSLDKLIPQIHQFLSGDKFQQLQQQFFGTVLTAAGNHWSLPNLSQAIQQLVTQFVPGASQMRIDWDEVGQTVLNTLASVGPGLLVTGLGALFGKRDLRVNYQQLLTELSVDKLAQIVQKRFIGD